MTTTTVLNKATSVSSLAAITAGAVGAALLIMSVGSIAAIISIGSSIDNGAQTTASLANQGSESIMMVAANSSVDKIHTDNKRFKKGEAIYYNDALLRENYMSTITPSSATPDDNALIARKLYRG
jgi:hypothetical protein